MEFWVATIVFEDPWKDDPIQVCIFFCNWMAQLIAHSTKHTAHLHELTVTVGSQPMHEFVVFGAYDRCKQF